MIQVKLFDLKTNSVDISSLSSRFKPIGREFASYKTPSLGIYMPISIKSLKKQDEKFWGVLVIIPYPKEFCRSKCG